MSKRVVTGIAGLVAIVGLLVASPMVRASDNCADGYQGGSAPAYAGPHGTGFAGGAGSAAGHLEGSDDGTSGCSEGSTSDGTVQGSGTRNGTDVNGSITVAGTTVTIP